LSTDDNEVVRGYRAKSDKLKTTGPMVNNAQENTVH